MNYRIDSNKVVWRNINGEAVIFHLDTGHYYGLNKVGTMVWAAFLQGESQAEIIDKIIEKYKISKDQALQDVVALVALLQKEGLITASHH